MNDGDLYVSIGTDTLTGGVVRHRLGVTNACEARLLAAAACFAMVIVLGSPFVGELRAAIASAFPGQARAIIGGAVAVAIAAALVTAVARVRDAPRPARLATSPSAAALVAGALFARALSSGDPNIDVVEAFHFVEYGILTLLFYLAWRPFDDVSVLVLPLLAGLLVGTLDEWFQWFIPLRVGELRDVLLDGAAVGCGLLFSIGVDPPGRFTLAMRRGSAMRIGAMAVVLTLVFALFFQTAFLGSRRPRSADRACFDRAIRRPNSRRRLAIDPQRWRGAPPPAAGRVSREDQYLTEALVARAAKERGGGRRRRVCRVAGESHPGNVLCAGPRPTQLCRPSRIRGGRRRSGPIPSGVRRMTAGRT